MLKKLAMVLAISAASSLPCHAQSTQDSLATAVRYGAEGDFEQAKEELEKLRNSGNAYDVFYVRRPLQIIEDVQVGNIRKETAIHLFKGVMHGEAKRLDENITEFKRAVQTDPGYAAAYADLALVYNAKGMWEEAMAEARKALGIEGDLVEAHYTLGQAYMGQEAYDQAIAAFENVLERNPDFISSHYDLAWAYYFEGQYENAIHHCDTARDLGLPVSPRLLKALEPHRE